MKRKSIVVGAVLFLSLVPPAFAELELGMSLFPTSEGSVAATPVNDLDWMVGFHVGYNFLSVGYVSWDAISLPNYMTQNLTGSYDLPSFLNLFDAGLRLSVGPLLAYGEVGLSSLWIYDVGLAPVGETGVNVRAGLGMRFDWWGVVVSATDVYPTFANLSSAGSGLLGESSGAQALSALESGLIWSAGLDFYLR